MRYSSLTQPKSIVESVQVGILQRKCACGQPTVAYGECAECREKPQEVLQRAAVNPSRAEAVPAIVQDVLRSPGQPLDPATRAEMESPFAHDFSHVRVNTDAKAAESAQAVQALAYTVGNQIVFGAGRYAPASAEGKRLLAHELTHTIQQTQAGPRATALSRATAEREADRSAAQVVAGARTQVAGQVAAGALQKDDANALDEKARKIIAAGKDTKKSIDQRAIDAVNDIVKAHYDPALVDSVSYDEGDPGLTTSPIGKGNDIKGQIKVGKYFIEHLESDFARRVLQVGHEMEHVRQQRSGMGGPAKKNEREFLAFHWEATQPEKAGTGKMPHSTRVALIDAGLKNYYCMPAADQKTHADKKDELSRLRATEETASGNPHKDPPTACEGR